MAEIKELTDSIEFKVRKLIFERNEAVRSLNMVSEENMKNILMIKELKAALLNAEERINAIQSAKQAISQGTGRDLSVQINELIREIDRCIAEIDG